MKTIYKYHLTVRDQQLLALPIGAEILTVQEQNDQLFIWALVDPNAGIGMVSILIIGTGNPIGPELHSKMKHVRHGLPESLARWKTEPFRGRGAVSPAQIKRCGNGASLSLHPIPDKPNKSD